MTVLGEGRAWAPDPLTADQALVVALEGVHLEERVGRLEQPLPLCWVADVRRQHPGEDHEALWAVSLDHESVPAYAATADRALVSCADCREWMHA